MRRRAVRRWRAEYAAEGGVEVAGSLVGSENREIRSLPDSGDVTEGGAEVLVTRWHRILEKQ